MTVNRKDLLAGLLFVGLGLAFGLGAVFTLHIGTAFRMGPGYLPVVLSILMVVLGLAVMAKSVGGAVAARDSIPWRGLLFVTATPVVFGLAVPRLGFVPTVALATLAAFYARRGNGVGFAAAMVVVIVGFCTLVFIGGLGLPIPLFAAWPPKP